MVTFTCITEVRGCSHLSQHAASGPEEALREHIAGLPYHDGEGPFDDELEWLLRVSKGAEAVALQPVSQCRGTWFWRDGASYEPRYLTYIVRTDVRDAD